MIQVEQLTVDYPGGHRALDALDLRLEPGQVHAILGPSGAGKSTLLLCLAGFLAPTRGRIRVEGRDLSTLDERALRQQIGIVFQGLHLFPHRTVLDNLTLAPIHVLGQPEDQAVEHATALLQHLGVGELAQRYPRQLSGGQAQRAAIARALMLKPPWLLLDEPTSALDVQTARDFGALLQELLADTTPVIVTHDTVFAEGVATRGVLLQAGGVAAEGSIAQLADTLEP